MRGTMRKCRSGRHRCSVRSARIMQIPGSAPMSCPGGFPPGFDGPHTPARLDGAPSTLHPDEAVDTASGQFSYRDANIGVGYNHPPFDTSCPARPTTHRAGRQWRVTAASPGAARVPVGGRGVNYVVAPVRIFLLRDFLALFGDLVARARG
jgi:hypothetical protein